MNSTRKSTTVRLTIGIIDMLNRYARRSRNGVIIRIKGEDIGLIHENGRLWFDDFGGAALEATNGVLVGCTIPRLTLRQIACYLGSEGSWKNSCGFKELNTIARWLPPFYTIDVMRKRIIEQRRHNGRVIFESFLVQRPCGIVVDDVVHLMDL